MMAYDTVNLSEGLTVYISEMNKVTGSRRSEALLVLSAQSGNQRAFDALIRSYQPALVKFAGRLSGDRQLALDAVQEAWITVAKNLAEIGSPYAFRANVFKAVRWRTIDQLRKQTREFVEFEDQYEDVSSNSHEMQATPNQIKNLISRLPAIDRQAIHLFYLEDMTINELAAVLEIPAGTVKSRLNRARNTLNKMLSGETNDID